MAYPAILYFFTAFWMVHLEAGRKGLMGLPKDECPNPWTAVRERWYLLLPLLGLVVLLFSGYTPMFSGTVGLALTVVLIFGAAVMQGLRGRALRFRQCADVTFYKNLNTVFCNGRLKAMAAV